MKDKRMQILDSAIRFFSEKGYYHTSMQDIASECGISKGSLYKEIDSKEDLLIQVFEYNHEKMFQRAKTMEFDEKIPPKSMLEKLIIIELEGAFENKDFFNIIYRSLPGEDNRNILAVMKRTRTTMMNWHRNTLLRVYGDKVEGRIWDLVITFQGIMKEFIFLISREGKTLEFKEVASYIASLLDTIVHHFPAQEPVLSDELMKEEQSRSFGIHLTKEEQQEAAFDSIRNSIERADVRQDKKDELLASVEMLADELKAKQPRSFLVGALLVYLEKAEEIKRETRRIRTLVSETDV